MRVRLVRLLQKLHLFHIVLEKFLNMIFADYKKGFGGEFGVQSDRQDKSAVGWSDHEKLAAHESQKG